MAAAQAVHHGLRFGLGLAVSVAAASLATPSFAGVTASGGCVDDVTGAFFPTRVPTNCTANDVAVVSLGGGQTDGCTSASDTLILFPRSVLRNVTDPPVTRYDIGVYLATDGDPNADGAVTGACARASLDPVGGTGVVSCGPAALDLDGPLAGNDLNVPGVADGPFLRAETGATSSAPDACGDLYSQATLTPACDDDGDALWDDTVYDFPTAISLPCQDSGGDGFVDVPTCVTWGNQPDEVHDDTGNVTCDSQAEVVPGTKSKCRCETLQSLIPVPQLGLGCSCDRTSLAAGEWTTCTATYTNSASCTQDLGTVERFRCGTGAFVRFAVDYPEARGAVSDPSASGTGGGGAAVDSKSGNARILWTPSSGLGSPGIVAPGESATLTFTFTLADDATSESTQLDTTTLWSNVSTFAPEVVQPAPSCSVTLSPGPPGLIFRDDFESAGTAAWDAAWSL